MTIKDIAKAAGVSVSTVSKILNHKDEKITEETRRKVLAIVEENQFVPYAKLRDKLTAPRDKAAVLIPELMTPFHSRFLETFTKILNKEGYTPMLFVTDYQYEQETAALNCVAEQKVPSVLMFPSDPAVIQRTDTDFPDPDGILLLNSNSHDIRCSQYYCDYEQGAMEAAEHLLMKGCRRTGLLIQEGNAYIEKSIRKGYQQALSAVLREYDESLVICYKHNVHQEISMLIDAGVDGIVCQDALCAKQVYETASARYLSIPQDISVISLEDYDSDYAFSPPLTAISYPAETLAALAARHVTARLDPREKNPAVSVSAIQGTLMERESVKHPVSETDRILVIGYLNMDIMMKIPHSPKPGQPLSASRLHCLPGGKGGNQAAAVARSGGNACMIGALGNDLYGKQIYEKLMRMDVNTQGIAFHNSLPSGTAYLSLLPDGNSLIIGNTGANERLDRSYIEEHLELFEDARYCLLQMETDMDTLTCILNICQEKGIHTIIKPNQHNPLPEALYSLVDIVVPNQKELDDLLPGNESVQQKSTLLLSKGFKHIIVTLGADGCLWTSAEGSHHFPAEDIHRVDATGASDIFIGYLATLLTEGKDMGTAVQMANYAAGLSIMWEGVQNAIPERRMVENHFIS